MMVCPVCGGRDYSILRDVFDDRYGHPDLFQLGRCRGCGHLITMPMLSEDDLSHLYGTYYPRKNLSADEVASQATDVKLPLGRFRRWWMGVNNQGQYSAKPGEKMLDVGCGSGLSLQEARELGVEAWGVEADPNVKRIASALDLRIHQGSLHDKPFEGVMFDLVVLNQVIEHIPEPDKALALIRTRLAHGGRVILSFPNTNSLWSRLAGPRWINWHIPYHLHHFTAKTFARMAERCGYKIVWTRTITPAIWTILQIRTIRQTVIRGQSNPIWSVETSGSTQQPKRVLRGLVGKLIKLPAMMVITLINRVVDCMGLGESLMMELKPEDNK